MVKIGLKQLLKRKRGQLFLLEVFIALSVLILLMVAIFQVEFTTIPTYQNDLSEIGYNALESMNQAGQLKPLIFNANIIELTANIEEILDENIVWRLSVEDNVNNILFQIYWDRMPPTGSSIGVVEYFLYGFEDNLSTYRIIYLQLWRLLG